MASWHHHLAWSKPLCYMFSSKGEVWSYFSEDNIPLHWGPADFKSVSRDAVSQKYHLWCEMACGSEQGFLTQTTK